MSELPILYRDDDFVAINKPHGLLVHRTKIAKNESQFALQLLRDQIQQYVYPIHRLDRKTAGVLIFGLHKEAAALFQQALRNHKVEKRYIAIIRGFFEKSQLVDYALTNDQGKIQNAITQFNLLENTELDIPFGRYTKSRYALIEAFPKTGRMHQIRKHCNHLRKPIIGDRPHGCNKQNRLFKEKWAMSTMMLHAISLSFCHPFTNENILIKAPVQTEMNRMLRVLDFKYRH